MKCLVSGAAGKNMLFSLSVDDCPSVSASLSPPIQFIIILHPI